VSYPPSKNRRKHPRFELFASVEVEQGGRTVVLPARNLSLGGLFVESDGHDLNRFPDGVILDVRIFDPRDPATAPVRSPARVMRHDRDSMALMWNATDPIVTEKLAEFLGKLSPLKK
jgi:hypothetical protein